MPLNNPAPTRVVVLGGGTAGWMSAAALAKLLDPLVEVNLIESEDIGIVGVGEATLPFMKATHATYKLGIDFRDFGRIGESYIHELGLGIGVTRTEREVVEVRQDPASGDVIALVLEDGRMIEGDLFIDCSGLCSGRRSARSGRIGRPGCPATAPRRCPARIPPRRSNPTPAPGVALLLHERPPLLVCYPRQLLTSAGLSLAPPQPPCG